jgi:NitT/TauT family transport system substrate-binding protein
MTLRALGVIAAWVAAALVVLSGVACSPVSLGPVASTPTAVARERVNVMWVAKVANMAPAWIALDAGYYDEQGLDVNLSYANGSPIGMAALISGQIEILQAAGTAVVTAAAGTQDPVKRPVQFIGTVNDAVFKLMVNPTINSLDQLRGQALCTSRPGSADVIALKLYLQRHQLDIDKDVSVIAAGSLEGCAASLQANQTAGSMLSTPFTALLQGLGFKPLVDFAKEKIRLQQLGVNTTNGYIQSHPDTLLRFTRAYIKGIHRFKTDRAFAEQAMRRYLDTTDQAQLDDAFETYRDVFEEVPLPSAEAFQNVIDTVPEAKGITPKDVMETRFVQQLQQEGFVNRLYGRP